jgi:hypothetical protein
VGTLDETCPPVASNTDEGELEGASDGVSDVSIPTEVACASGGICDGAVLGCSDAVRLGRVDGSCEGRTVGIKVRVTV